MASWTPQEIQFLSRNLNLPTRDLFLEYQKEFGAERGYNSVQKKVKALREAYTSVDDDIQTFEVATFYTVPENLFVDRPTLTEKKLASQDAIEWVKDLAKSTQNELANLGTVQGRGPVNSPKSSLVVVLSDTHFGKYTSSFNMKVATQRMKSIPITIASRALPEIDEVVVILAGDMIEGEDIYPTQNGAIECSVIEQTTTCAQTIWETILLFRKLFNCRVRIETCPGNHGRMSKSADPKSNWDNVVYHIVNTLALFSGDPEIVVKCNFDSFVTFQVKDTIGLAYHKGVKHTGTPAMQVKVAGWLKSKEFDWMVHGHWHEWHIGVVMGKFVVGNGCMCGPDDLAEEMGKEEDPRQAYFLVTPGQPVHGFSFCEWPA